jgi:hypothetical protein
MRKQRLNRRSFLQAAGAAVALGAAGCGGATAPVAPTVAEAVRIVIQVSWKYLTKLLEAVIHRGGELVVRALVDEAVQEIKAQLSYEQQKDLGKGAKLILRTEDGKEHEVPFKWE